MEFMAKIEMQQTMYEMRREAVSLTSFRYVFWCSAVIKAVDFILHIHPFLFSGLGSGSLSPPCFCYRCLFRFFLLFVGFKFANFFLNFWWFFFWLQRLWFTRCSSRVFSDQTVLFSDNDFGICWQTLKHLF